MEGGDVTGSATVVALVVGAIGFGWAAWPISLERASRFAYRYGLAAEPASVGVRVYLTVHRRCGVSAVTLVLVGSVLAGLDHRRISVSYPLVVGAWLVATVIAELWLRAKARVAGIAPAASQIVDRRLTRVLLGLGGLGLIITVTLGAISDAQAAPTYLQPPTMTPGGIVRAGVFGLATVLATLVAVRLIAARPIGSGDADEIAALTRDSTYVVTAGGFGLATLWFMTVVSGLGPRQPGWAGAALIDAGVIGVVAGLVAAVLLAAGRWRRSLLTGALPRWGVGLIALAVTAGVSLIALPNVHDHAPYPPDVLHARASVAIVDGDHVNAAAAALGLEEMDAPIASGTDQDIVARIDFDVPSAARGAGWYYATLIDTSTNRVPEWLTGGVSTGWHGALSVFASQYPQLSALAEGDPSASIVPAEWPGPIILSTVFAQRGPVKADQLLIVIMFMGPDGQVYWALTVHPTQTYV
jgi:hypothetical protein